MANATNILVGRSVGHDWAVFMAASGQFCWPPMGSSDWPLTAVLIVAMTTSDRTDFKGRHKNQLIKAAKVMQIDTDFELIAPVAGGE